MAKAIPRESVAAHREARSGEANPYPDRAGLAAWSIPHFATHMPFHALLFAICDRGAE